MKYQPNMIYGTAWKKEATADLVELAVFCGFRAIDTACQPRHYREELVGQGIQNALVKNNLNREDIYIQTKFTPQGGQDPSTIPYNPNDDIAEQIKTSFEVSKKNLQTSYIDSYILHSPITPYPELSKAWEVMESFVDAGEVGQIGISNCYDLSLLARIYHDAEIKPKVLQNRFYNQTDYDNELRAFCKSLDIGYQSFWSLSANPHILASPVVQTLAKKYQKTNEQIFYRFLTQIDITPLNGTTSKKHMLEDLDIFSFVLLQEELDSISVYINL
ncbi:MAG: aldo/keto reductase [Sulfurospirillaceae bacterium]|nr:aldo/keto reductase [Sulfurospirillaceae bacterium]